MFTLACDRAYLYGHPERELTNDERARYEEALTQRAKGIPSQYITGHQEFWGMDFIVSPAVLIPRPETEHVIERVLEVLAAGRGAETARRRPRLADVGTGSGCIGIAMAVHNPEWQVDLADISDDALSLARENIEYQDCADRVRAISSDLFAGLGGNRYDLIVSNPPYVTEQEYAALPPEYSHEPALGLRAGEDGLDFALRILASAAEHLSDEGVLIVEVGESEKALVELLPEVPFNWIEFEVGQMGVFLLDRDDLVEHANAIRAAAKSRH